MRLILWNSPQQRIQSSCLRYLDQALLCWMRETMGESQSNPQHRFLLVILMATLDQQTQNKAVVKDASEQPQRELINKHPSIPGCYPSLRNLRREDLECDRDWANVSFPLGLLTSNSKLPSSLGSTWSTAFLPADKNSIYIQQCCEG